MNTLIITFAVIGAIAIILIVTFGIMEGISEATERKREKQYWQKGREVADRLDIAYWFGSDPHVYNALYLLHYQLKENGCVDAERIRDFVKECGDKTCNRLREESTERFFV